MAAAVPLAASILALLLGLAIGGRQIDTTVSFHGRTPKQATRPVRGLLYTAQSIPENLILGNLGLATRTTQSQGAIITAALVLVWISSVVCRGGGREQPRFDDAWRLVDVTAAIGNLAPLECAGSVLLVGSYVIEWSARGYMDYQYLRTINLRDIVPWYDLLPQIGLVLFLAGWWSASHRGARPRLPGSPAKILTPGGTLTAVLLALLLIALNRPRVDGLVRASVPGLTPWESKAYPTVRLQTVRANAVLNERTRWQRSYLRRLDRAEAIAQRMQLSCATIRSVFGNVSLPVAGHGPPVQAELYDVAALLDLPEKGGRAIDGAAVYGALRSTWNASRSHDRDGLPATKPGLPIDWRASKSPAVVGRLSDGGKVFKSCQVLDERKFDRPGRSIAILGHDQLGHARLVAGIVVIGAMQE